MNNSKSYMGKKEREALITQHQHQPFFAKKIAVKIFEKIKMGRKWIKNGDKINEQFEKLDGKKGPNHINQYQLSLQQKN